MLRSLLFIFSLFVSSSVFTQNNYYQYFDGANTSPTNSLIVTLDTSSGNVWQIGSPQKTIFDESYSPTKAIVTDTLSNYPINVNSSFMVEFPFYSSWVAGLQMEWKQKHDLEDHADWGIVEFSNNKNGPWYTIFENSFNNGNHFDVYSFDTLMVDTTSQGEWGFTGKDTTWKTVNLLINIISSNPPVFDSVMYIKFTLRSDSNHTNQEGWMIDDFVATTSFGGAIGEKSYEDLLMIYPTITLDKLQFKRMNNSTFSTIDQIEIFSVEGKKVMDKQNVNLQEGVDVRNLREGTYILKVRVDDKIQSLRFVKL